MDATTYLSTALTLEARADLLRMVCDRLQLVRSNALSAEHFYRALLAEIGTLEVLRDSTLAQARNYRAEAIRLTTKSEEK